MLHRSVILSPSCPLAYLHSLRQPTCRTSSPHVNAHQEAPSSRYSTVFHWHAVPSSSLHLTRRLSCYSYWSLFFFQTSLSLFHLSYLFTSLLFSYLFIFSSIWETFLVWEENREDVGNFEGHFLIQPNCTLLYFSCIISTQQKGCPSRSERCSYSKMSLSMWVGQSFSKKALTSGSRRAPTNLSIGFPSRKAMTVGKAVT